MIVTDYRNLEFYSEVPHAKEVIDFIDGFKKTEMKTGRYDILGDVLFPEDGHRPNVMHKEIENVLKIVFKIKK